MKFCMWNKMAVERNNGIPMISCQLFLELGLASSQETFILYAALFVVEKLSQI